MQTYFASQSAYDAAEQDLIEIDTFAEDVACAIDDVEAYLADPACDEVLSRDLVASYGWSAAITDAVCAALGVK